MKNIDEVYTRGAVQLARLGRESPLGVGAMSGAALRDPTYSSAAARSIYTNPSGPVADEPGGQHGRGRRDRHRGRRDGDQRRRVGASDGE